MSYHHSAILPVIVAPEQEHVLSLMPEFIRPQDGVEKQDSETAAAKRWITAHHDLVEPGCLTVLGDDLYSRQPMCQTGIDHQVNFISENENHNVLKTKGYHRSHNFGHGHHHLAMTLLTLNVLAFLFHTVLHLVDVAYQRIRQQRGTRKGFFQDIQTLTKYLLFDAWQHLIDFMLEDSTPTPTSNTS